uniref:Uncharacterized protein n=1 Tax=Anguilla anguilla TaxID=7936 RepID=A0A0E9V4V8_ANGAN
MVQQRFPLASYQFSHGTHPQSLPIL